MRAKNANTKQPASVRKALAWMREGEGLRIEGAASLTHWRDHRRPANALFLVTARSSGEFVAWFTEADKLAWDVAAEALYRKMERRAA